VPNTILGLPAHPLIVHAVVVLVPLAALLVAASAVSARFRQWSRYATPLTALVALAMVPLATQSGEGLEGSIPHSPVVEQHAELADSLLPLMAGLVVLALVQAWLHRRTVNGRVHDSVPRIATVTVAVLAVLVSLGTLVQVGRIGHSGAKAVWSDVKVSGGSGESGESR